MFYTKNLKLFSDDLAYLDMLNESLSDKSFWEYFFSTGNFRVDDFSKGLRIKEDQYEITLDLPGIKKEEIKIEVIEGDLLRVNVKSEKRKIDSVLKYCIHKGNAKEAKITLEDGVLTIIIPFKEEMKPFEIEVK